MIINQNEEHSSPEADHQGLAARRWLAGIFIFISLILLGVLTYAVLTSADIFPSQSETPFITITEPVAGSVLSPDSQVIIRGQAGGLPGETLVVQVLNSAGNVLVQRQATIDSPEDAADGGGSWSMGILVVAPPGTGGQILAFATSPEDESTIASAVLDVSFGVSLAGGEMFDLRDHLWALVSLYGNPPIEGTQIDLQFNDFLVDGSGGCNIYTASYESRRSNLNIGFVTSTAKECKIPPGILNQEKAYFTALEEAATYIIAARQLNLFDGSGNPILVYQAVVMGSVTALIGTELPENALVSISLLDLAEEDAGAEPVAEQIVANASAFPIPFALRYDPREIRSQGTYALRVIIEDDQGNLLFATPAFLPVIIGDNPSRIEVFVEPVR